jgi:phosphohistidine phosphatase
MQLFLMRHATTEKLGATKDIERILTPQGHDEAVQAGLFLRNYSIDKALVSYAVRTTQTFKIIQEQHNIQEVEYVTELYHQSEEEVIELIANQNSSCKQILVVGHNPVIYHIALMLAKKESALCDQLMQNIMPPAQIIALYFSHINSWQDIKTNSGTISDLFTPKNML